MASSYFKLKLLKRKHTEMKLSNLKRFDKLKNIEKPSCNTDLKCRICLFEGNIPIYGNKDSADISDNVKTFGDITISEDDNFPKYMCDACYSLLQNAIQFRKTAKKSQEMLHKASSIICHQTDLSEEKDFSGSESEDNNTVKNTQECFKCYLCDVEFGSSEDYVSHKNSTKHKNVRIQCKTCNSLITAQSYKRHLKRHETSTHMICEVCGKVFRKDNLIRHLQLHSYELPYQCQICPYRGRFMESLKNHMRTHTGIKPFSCEKCQLRFLTRSNLNRHLLTHRKERPFKCVECGRSFYTKRDMDIHFKSEHSGVKDFGCMLCGNKFGTRKALMRHELRVHKRDKMAKGRKPLYLQDEYRKTVY